METILSLGVAMVAGLLMSRLVKLLKLPAVTGYLIAGILIGPNLLGALGVPGLGIGGDQLKGFNIISDVALGFIAFAIGNEFRLSNLRTIGKQATVVAFTQALAATLLVDLCLIGLHYAIPDKLPMEAAITLGAIATATAPAATLMVVRQYKAKGPLTGILLPVVALDDAVGLVVFAISFGIARSMLSGTMSIITMLINPLIEVVLSLGLGAALGFLFTLAEKLFKSNSKRLCLAITFVLVGVALAKLDIGIGSEVRIQFSSLLVCMMLGTNFCNTCKESPEIMEKTDKWTSPLFMLFFVISGAELEFSFFTDLVVVGVGLLYIVARSAGKYLGSLFGCKITKCQPQVTKYLGITLLPQAGVALGMALEVTTQMPSAEGHMVANITLFGVLIYELLGPLLTKIALTKAGEIVPKTKAELAAEGPDEDDD